MFDNQEKTLLNADSLITTLRKNSDIPELQQKITQINAAIENVATSLSAVANGNLQNYQPVSEEVYKNLELILHRNQIPNLASSGFIDIPVTVQPMNEPANDNLARKPMDPNKKSVELPNFSLPEGANIEDLMRVKIRQISLGSKQFDMITVKFTDPRRHDLHYFCPRDFYKKHELNKPILGNIFNRAK